MSRKQLSLRYAKALYDVSAEKKSTEEVFSQLRALSDLFQRKEMLDFVSEPMLRAVDKEKALAGALAGSGLHQDVLNFIGFLANKNRLELFAEILEAFQNQVDRSNGVTRGTVRSATVLLPEERSRLEGLVGRATGKRVILNYTKDDSVIGGSIAQVGSFCFDDTLASHLRRLREELKRRAY